MNASRTNGFVWLMALISWMSVIFFLSAQSGFSTHANPPLSFYLERKGAHAAEYFILAFLLFRTFRAFFPEEKRGLILACTVTLTLLYAVSDEFHQTFVFGREGKASDVLIDGISIALFIAGYIFLVRLKKFPKS